MRRARPQQPSPERGREWQRHEGMKRRVLRDQPQLFELLKRSERLSKKYATDSLPLSVNREGIPQFPV